MHASQALDITSTVRNGHPFYDGIPAGKEAQAATILEGMGIPAPYTGTPLEGWQSEEDLAQARHEAQHDTMEDADSDLS